MMHDRRPLGVGVALSMILLHVVIVTAFCSVGKIPTYRVTSIAPGQNTTFFLARPNDKLSDLPRHPADLDTPQECIVCFQDNGDDDSPLECDKVPIFICPLGPEARCLPTVSLSATLRTTWGV